MDVSTPDHVSDLTRTTAPDLSGIDLSGSVRRVRSSGRDVGRRWGVPSESRILTRDPPNRLTEAALAAQDRLVPPPRALNGVNVRGYRAFLDKTTDLPNLMDADDATEVTESVGAGPEPTATSPRLCSTTISEERSATVAPSDVFDDVTVGTEDGHLSPLRPQQQHDSSFRDASSSVFDGVAASDVFDGVARADDDDDPRRTSTSFRSTSSSIFDGVDDVSPTPAPSAVVDLSAYRVRASDVRRLVRYYKRRFGEGADDDRRAFALFEMRSRVTASDISRGSARRGGAAPTDDVVLTVAGRAAMRVRDACVVSKAWRDGAGPRDVVAADRATRGRPPVRRVVAADGAVVEEEARWLDDADFAVLRCLSVGPRRHMYGAEMFTVGDCRSLLLRMTDDHCRRLRAELDEATSRQIDAEDAMNEEAAAFDPFGGGDGEMNMTDAEMRYLSAMADVKSRARRLVVAERSLESVRHQIESLVERYRTLLSTMEGQDDDEDEDDDDDESRRDDPDEDEDVERRSLSRRAQRAELKAEVAAREAAVAKEETERVRSQKQRELDELQKRLDELETKSRHERRDFEQRLDLERRSASATSYASGHDLLRTLGARRDGDGGDADGDKARTKERLKARFRTRRAEKKDMSEEEMFQHVEFYERSLKTVETT